VTSAVSAIGGRRTSVRPVTRVPVAAMQWAGRPFISNLDVSPRALRDKHDQQCDRNGQHYRGDGTAQVQPSLIEGLVQKVAYGSARNWLRVSMPAFEAQGETFTAVVTAPLSRFAESPRSDTALIDPSAASNDDSGVMMRLGGGRLIISWEIQPLTAFTGRSNAGAFDS